jgi:hypothetical protein
MPGALSPEGMGVSKHKGTILLAVCVAICWLAGCSSSSAPKAPANLQLTPNVTPVIELSAAGTASVSIQANQSVTWSLQSATGHGNPPSGASVSPTTGTSTTFTFTGPLQSCTSGASAPLQVEVVATTPSTPAESSILTVNVIQTPPCLAGVPIVNGNQSYTSCPASGTVITSLLGATQPLQELTQVGAMTQATISVGASGGVPYGEPPYTWAQTGSLPPGLSLTPGATTSSVVISGTPSTPGCTSFQLQVTDADGGVSCDPTVTTSCVPTTLNILVLPKALTVEVPPYSYSYDGTPYPPITLVASNGTLPLTWQQDPSGNSTLPPGLAISAGSNSTFVEVSGTPNAGDSQGFNATGSPNLGQYPTVIYVTDSQTPYPAVGAAHLKMQDYVPSTACSSAPSSPLYIQPTGTTGNGGTLTGGQVLADNYMAGTYAFMLRGFDQKQPTVIAGSMTLDGNGNVTSGIEDFTRGTTSSLGVPITAGSYTVGLAPGNAGVSTVYNRGCVTLTSTAGTLTFDFSLGGCSNHYTEGGVPATNDNACGLTQNGQGANQSAGTFTTGRIIEADDGTGQSAQLSGILRAQNISSLAGGLSGPYAFGMGGWDSSSGHYSIAGSAQAISSSLSSVAADIDDAGTVSAQLTGGSGTLTTADANGRIPATLTVGPASLDLALYVVSANEAFVVTTDALSAAHPLLSGEALTTSSTFSNASLQNSHMLAIGGLASSGPDVSIGLLAFDGQGGVTGSVYEDQAGTLSTTQVSAIYSVDSSTGRAPFTTPQNTQTIGAHTFVAYLIPPSANLTHTNCSIPASCVTGFVVGNDNTAQDGLLEFQIPTNGPPPPFTNRYVAGDFVYGTTESLDSIAASFEGDVYATPSSSNTTGGNLGTSQFPFYQDSSYGCIGTNCPVFIPEDTFTGAYTFGASGIGTFGGGLIVSVTNGNVSFYIDESPSNTHPSVIVAEQ